MGLPNVPTDRAGVCLITGGSSGIGLATAHALLRLGYCVVIAGRDAKRLAAAVASVPDALRSRLLAVEADVCVADSGPQLVRATVDHFGALDHVVCAAAVAPRQALDTFDDAQIEDVLVTNLLSPMRLVRAALADLSRPGDSASAASLGRCSVVMISSVASFAPFRGFSVYGASKAAINTFAKAMAQECAVEPGQCGKRAIEFFSIAPGAVETPMLRAIATLEQVPAAACLQPAEVADEIVCCIRGERTPYNGQTLVLQRYALSDPLAGERCAAAGRRGQLGPVVVDVLG